MSSEEKQVLTQLKKMRVKLDFKRDQKFSKNLFNELYQEKLLVMLPINLNFAKTRF
jgi:hypothetical protein